MSGGSKFEDKRFGADELGDAITRSRALLPAAVDALCETITEVTGKAPSRERVEFVDTFWLMHACDREIYGQPHSVLNMVVEPDPLWPSDRRMRSDIFSVLGARNAPVRIADPYLKTAFSEELSAALRARREMRWQSVVRPRVKSWDVLTERRLAIARRFAAQDGESNTLRRAVVLLAPLDVLEQHHELTAWAQGAADETAKACYSANAHQASTSFRHYLYEQRKLGSKIIFHQHGGGNGIDEQHPGEFHDTLIGDVFYSWGWQRPELGQRVRPLPTALPARHTAPPSRDCLLMSLPVTAHFYRFQPFLVPYHVERAVEETVTFARNLGGGNGLCMRSSGVSKFPVDRLTGMKATLTIDKGREPGAKAASRYRLVVHNYLGTTWLETLAMNIPTVCFYDPAVFRPRESARPYFELLTRVGVLHHSGAAAARFVNDLRGDPASWWQKSEVQEARETFVARYANFKADWLPGWLQEFERLLAE
jgi:putative transferase (TIGR04331 family)